LNISRALLYNRLSCECFGVIPIRIGRKVLFSRRELLAYIDAGMPSRTKWQAMKKASQVFVPTAPPAFYIISLVNP